MAQPLFLFGDLFQRLEKLAVQHHPGGVVVGAGRGGVHADQVKVGLPAGSGLSGRDGDLLTVQEVDRLGRNLLEGLIVLTDLFQRGVGVNVLEGIAAGEHTERSLILDLALALAEDRRRDITRKTKNGLEAARKRGRVGGRRPVVDDDKRAAILARRQRGESIRTIAAGVKVSIGVVHKTLTDAQADTQRAVAAAEDTAR